jgi:peptidoglycan/LPS O-acetylase OafA/YrhL
VRQAPVGIKASRLAVDEAKRRITELDGVRGIAVLMVISRHAFFSVMGAEGWSGLPRLVAMATKAGWLGVDLFFVLSGFLITGILLDTKRDRHYLRNFYARRALRILPLYYATLLVIFFCYPHAGLFVLLSFFYLSNVAPLFGVPMAYGPLWSLAVEEHFYLIWPWVVRVTSKRGLAMIAAAICAGEPIIRAIGFAHGSDTYYYSWFRFDGLAWGALLALFFRSSLCTRTRLWQMAGAGALCGLVMFAAGAPFGITTREQAAGATLQYTAAQLVFVGLVAAALGAAGSKLGGLFNWRPLRWCGDVSYSLYLIHMLVFEAWDSAVARLPINSEAALGRFGSILLRAFVVLAASFALAAVSYRYFESPVLRLKRLFG